MLSLIIIQFLLFTIISNKQVLSEMAATKLDGLLKSKFRGCMLGTLVGDCLGSPFEGEPGSKVVTQKYFENIDSPYKKCKFLPYNSSILFILTIYSTTETVHR